MMIVVALLGIAMAMIGFRFIEKRRREGTLTYPLWRGNLLIPWSLLVLLCALVIGSIHLPQYVKLAMRAVAGNASVTALRAREHCGIEYRYTVKGVDYTGSDNQCGVKPGDMHAVYYDPLSPAISTLYLPADALRNELVAMAFICLCLPTILVLWLMMTYVIGRPLKNGEAKP